MASQSRTGPSGPFTSSTAASAASVVIGVQRALRFGKLQSIGLTGTHPIHVSALSGPGISPLSGQLFPETGGRADLLPGFLSPLGAPAFASWIVLSRRGFQPSSRSAYLTNVRPPGPRRGFHVPHERVATGVGALSTPGRRCPPRRPLLPPGACRFPAASPPPRCSSHLARLALTRHTRVHCHSPVRSSPCLWPPGGAAALGLLPRASHPALTRGAR